jgi:molybdenum cofactor cytidylyltransferase
MVPAIVLAAGRSSRMGTSKALLPAHPGGFTFVRTLAAALLSGGAADVLVVGRPDDALLIEEAAELDRVRFVPNPAAHLGQLSSVVAGVNAADRPGVTAVLVAPVDAPFVTPGTIAALLAAWHSSGAPIVRATHHGRHGHPVLFGRPLFDELRSADPNVGAKAVVRKYADRMVNLEVDDPAVLHDIDRPDDYARALASVPPAP